MGEVDKLPTAFSESRVLRVVRTLGVGCAVTAAAGAFMWFTTQARLAAAFGVSIMATEVFRHPHLASVNTFSRAAIVVLPSTFFAFLLSWMEDIGNPVLNNVLESITLTVVFAAPIAIMFAWPMDRILRRDGIRSRDHAEAILAAVVGVWSLLALVWATMKENTPDMQKMGHPMAFVFGGAGVLCAVTTLAIVLTRMRARSRFLKSVAAGAEPWFTMESEAGGHVLVRVPVGETAVYRVGARRDAILSWDEHGEVRAMKGPP